MLVADDEEMVRVSVAAILSIFGHEVLLAKDGVEALLIFQSRHREISIVLMDITMPQMDGVAAANKIKLINPSVKVILMSGYSEQLVTEGTTDAFLPKPFRSKDLNETVEHVLKMA
jgi:YesN/AraC family two-component response regulator